MISIFFVVCRKIIYILGLLIEPSKDYLRLIKKNRRATSLNVCLATRNVPHEVEFYNYDMVGGIKGNRKIEFGSTCI